MPRDKKIPKRVIIPDPIYDNRLVTRFVNRMMRDGKKTIAQRLIYKALETIKEKGQDPVKTFETAVSNVGPRMEVRSRRVGGASYQVPMEVRGDRRQALAIRWILASAQKRSSKEYHTFDQKLAAEFLDASQNLGEAIKKRDNTHRMADANRAFAHFRW
ncbi:MAG: 30S ribosomal protein S7 [Patescibacteria group bacterium]|nr:30S ribosomal protein S7 [bacterium]MDZ7586880.1 30S ribosomal protein S7 [Patescibacteria group bacterium]